MVKIIQTIEKECPGRLISDLLGMEKFGWESCFYKRQPNKITASALFTSFFEMHQRGKNTLKNWTVQLNKLTGGLVTEQSLNERLNEQSVEMAKMVLRQCLNLKMDRKTLKKAKGGVSSFTGLFNRILIRDSTTQQLPDHLNELFPGSHSQGGAIAISRIQALFDFTGAEWVDFEIGAFTDNDQMAAPIIEKHLQPNDLILQDLGYFSLDWLEQLIENKYVITRLKPGVHVFGTDGVKLDLAGLLKKGKETDIDVLAGAKKRLPMRLVARKLPKGEAQKRVREARKDRHSRAAHSEEYYELLKYEIYLTNIPKESVDGKGIAKLYGLRWHIEILFKSWKSYGNFKALFEKKRMHLHRAKFTIYAALAEFAYFQNYIFNFIQDKIEHGFGKHLSCLKFMDVVNDIFTYILNIESPYQLEKYIPLFKAKATYKKHSKRKNTMEKYLYVNELYIAEH